MDRRTLLALTLSFVLLMFYQTFMEIYFPSTPVDVASNTAGSKALDVPDAVVGKGTEKLSLTRTEPLLPVVEPVTHEVVDNTLLSFENAVSRGQISLTGARLVSLAFLKHLDKLAPDGRPIQFLQNGATLRAKDLFFAESGFLATVGIKTPNRKTVWSVHGDSSGILPGGHRKTLWSVYENSEETLRDGGTIKLVWDNGAGLRFEKSFIISPHSYLITVRDRVFNQADKAVPLYHFAQFVRAEPAPDKGQALAVSDFQGPMGYLDQMRLQHSYEDLRQADKHMNAQSGWVGFSDKYFLASLMAPDTGGLKKYYFDHDVPTYRVGMVSTQNTIDPGQSVDFETHLFVGPKEIRSLEAQGASLERSIDYGWFHFLAVPLVDVMLFLNDFMNNYGVAIIFLTLLVKALFYPLANKSYRSMNAMKKLQPNIEESRKLYGKDKTRLNQEMMQLYQNNKVNPLGGCLPILVQLPVFFALYQVLYLSVEMRHAPFILWIQDLSVMDPYYVLPILMGASMFVQSYLNPAPADPIQAKVMMFLPVLFTFMFLSFPAGLVLYWLVNNVLSIAQQYYIMKQMD